jgi:hypothetical protein
VSGVPDPGSALQRIVDGDRVVHIPDVVDNEAYRSSVASRLKLVELTGARTARISNAFVCHDVIPQWHLAQTA